MKLSTEMIAFFDGFLSVFQIEQIKRNKKNIYDLLNDCQYDWFFEELANPKESQECRECGYINPLEHMMDVVEYCPNCRNYDDFEQGYIDHLGNVYDSNGKYSYNEDEVK